MVKRRFSEIVANAFRARKSPHLQRRGSCRTYVSVGSALHHHAEDGVRSDVQSMAAGAAAPTVDDLIRTAIPADPFWQADLVFPRISEAQQIESCPSRSASIKSRANLSVTLPSSSTSHAVVQAVASASPQSAHFAHDARRQSKPSRVFVPRTDAESLKDALSPPSPSTSQLLPPTPSSSLYSQPFSDHQDQAAKARARVSSLCNDMPPAHAGTLNSTPAMVTQPLTASPSPLSGSSESSAPRPTRPGRPTLTRLNTSEILRSQTSTAFELGPIQPSATRKSPTALKLQLDTSVPRRSATLSSYPHPNNSKHKNLLHPPLPLLTPPTPVCDLFTPEAGGAAFSCAIDQSAKSGSDPNGRQLDAQIVEPHLARRKSSFEDFEFEVSTVLPDFLYLGPDVQSEQDVAQLKAIGVRRILNVACEIDELGPLKLRDRFEHYLKLPMLDSVEAKGVQDSIQEACSFLDDARLRSEPVYVHCKAGKSRSVTIVIAYLIHALGWSLQRSYSYVVERRAVICPNIGFVAELMRYEERELKLSRSTGIYGSPMAASPSSALNSSAQLLPAWGASKAEEQTKASDSTPSLSTSEQQGVQQPRVVNEHLTSNSSFTFGGTMSKSSPDLSPLAFGSQ